MRRRLVYLAFLGIGVGLILAYLVLSGRFSFRRQVPLPDYEKEIVLPEEEVLTIKVNQPSDYHLLRAPKHMYQTFNNCGPATLSMVLFWYGIEKSQKELADLMRPYQHPKGDNDDKTIFPEEFAKTAQDFGLLAINRPNGTIEQLKYFVANDIPVVVKTWLRPNEDIGHFRIVRGFDETKKVIIQDDSYHGPNKKIAYNKFLLMWQSFNYGYIVVYPEEKEEKVLVILGEEKEEKVAWQNAANRAQKEIEADPENIYSWFNLSASYYHLGQYQKSVEAFKKVENRLPKRMLWYQIEPILSYKALEDYERVFEIVDHILSHGNQAFSELYLIRGEIYLEQNNPTAARQEFELALLYNKNYQPVKEVLKNLE